MQFRVGDKVRLRYNTVGDFHVTGESGEIIEFDHEDEDDHYINVRFDNPDRDGDLECYVSVAMITPRIDPTMITRLNEVVTMLEHGKTLYADTKTYWAKMLETPDAMTWGSEDKARRAYDAATAEHDNIVARIVALSKVIEELTKA